MVFFQFPRKQPLRLNDPPIPCVIDQGANRDLSFTERFADITKVMHRKNFWYPLVWSLREYRAKAKPQGSNRVYSSPEPCVRGGSAADWRMGRDQPPLAWGQEFNRKVKSKVTPSYPELARRLNITGVVKVQVTVSANGSVKDAKVMGGHPVLVNAAMDAVKKWRFETASQETTGMVEFHFDPTQ